MDVWYYGYTEGLYLPIIIAGTFLFWVVVGIVQEIINKRERKRNGR